MIIDFHTHAFPDDLAGKAVSGLGYNSKLKPSYDGTTGGLLKSMDEAGIEKSVVLNIATKPAQAENIINWCLKVRSRRIIPFASIHPDNGNFPVIIGRIKNEGIRGIKLHPMYQDFYADDEKMFPVYEKITKENLILIFHSGFDIAFPEDGRASVERILRVHEKFPELKIVASHTGGWKMWDEVLKLIAGKDIWLEISMTLKYIEDMETFYGILKGHSPDKILFGTDAPWGNQKEDVKAVKELNVSPDLKEKIFHENARALLSSK
ncbi:MAG: amidohydrolase family protein [bacterium]